MTLLFVCVQGLVIFTPSNDTVGTDVANYFGSVVEYPLQSDDVSPIPVFFF
jgi:hypothetical protein